MNKKQLAKVIIQTYGKMYDFKWDQSKVELLAQDILEAHIDNVENTNEPGELTQVLKGTIEESEEK